jgi:OmpA-like transmembrane domain
MRLDVTRMPRYLVLSFIAVICLAAGGHRARADDLTGFYVGGSFGRSQLDYDTSRYETQLIAQASSFGKLEFTTAAPRRGSNAWWANTGYMVWPYLGIDASFLHLGELTDRNGGTYTQTGGKTQSAIATTALRSNGPALGLLLRVPVVESIDVNVRIGDYFAKTNLVNGVDVNTYTVTPQASKTSSLMLGVGGAFTFAGHWSGRIDLLRINKAGNSATVGTYNVSMASIGVSYTF